MPDRRQEAHHSLNGDELRTIIEDRVHQGILQAMNLRAMYAYPLVRYSVTIQVIPYESQGPGDPVRNDKFLERCVVEGREFVEVREEAVELEHDSPIIGWEKDPQVEREETGLGRMETHRVEGQYVDTRVKSKISVKDPELPPVGGRVPRTPALAEDHKPVDVAAGLKKGPAISYAASNDLNIPPEQAQRIARQEAEDWATPAMDPEIHDAIASEKELPGRVTVLKK